jgi:hypothetical protein
LRVAKPVALPWIERTPGGVYSRVACGDAAADHVELGGEAVRAWPIVIGILLLLASVRPAEAQVLRGRLLDLDSEEPIEGGVVTLMDSTGARLRSSVTETDGRYELRAPGPGTYLVEARRLGYRSWVDGPVELLADEVWDSAFHLQVIPITLDPLEIVAEAALREAYLQRVGFYERQKVDYGHFITRAEIERRRPARMTDLLLGVPGARAAPSGDGLNRASISFGGSLQQRGGPCHPRVFVDGLVVIRGDARPHGLDPQGLAERGSEAAGRGVMTQREIALDDVVMPEDVQAVEVYRRGSEVPVRFGGMSTETQCGAIVVWTRRGWGPNR